MRKYYAAMGVGSLLTLYPEIKSDPGEKKLVLLTLTADGRSREELYKDLEEMGFVIPEEERGTPQYLYSQYNPPQFRVFVQGDSA